MNATVERRLKELAARAGLGGVPANALVAGSVVLLLAVVLAAWRYWPRQGGEEVFRSSSAAVEQAPRREASEEVTEPARVYVHVIGAVARPGVYDLATGSRVIDAVTAAGGLLGDAAPAGVNLARQVADGEQVAVPTKDQFAKGEGVPDAAGGAATGHAGTSAAPSKSVVDINAADAASLDTLPGVGPSTAQKIVADREANGPFANVEDLGRVPGIGPKKLDQLKGLISAN